MSGCRPDNLLLSKVSFLYRGETESQADSCQVYSERKKRTNIYMYTHKYACSNVCVYVERDRIRVKQRVVRYTQKSKQTEMLVVCLCMYDCMTSESESASHSSPPQLKGVRAISACVRACVLTGVVHAHKSGQTKNKYVHSL